MNESITEKEKLLMIFSDMNNQLAELESILRNSFSDLRSDLIREEEDKLSSTDEKISLFERSYRNREESMQEEMTNYSLEKNQSVGLKLELGF